MTFAITGWSFQGLFVSSLLLLFLAFPYSQLELAKVESFTCPKQLYATMGHEFVHVSQYAKLAGQSVSLMSDEFFSMLDYHAYSFESSVLNTKSFNSFSREEISMMMTKWPNWFEELNYMKFRWTTNIHF